LSRKSNHISLLQFDIHMLSHMRIERSSKGIAVLSYATEAGSWEDEGALDTALKSFVERNNLVEDELYSILPRHELTLRILTLPSQDDQEIAGMIHLSAEEYVPFPLDELIIDHAILEKMPTGESRVLITLAHRDVVEAHISLLRKSGLEPEKILLSSACLASIGIAAYEPRDERYALLNLGASGLEMVVIDNGRLHFSRGVASTQDWRRAEEENSDEREELALEVRNSLAAYRRDSEDGLGVDKLFLGSEYAIVTKTSEVLETETAKDCAPAEFVRKLVVSGNEKMATLPLVMLGAALAAQDRGAIRINLLPDSVIQGRALETTKHTVYIAAAMVVAVVIALGILYTQAILQRTAMIRQLEDQIAVIQPGALGVQAMRQQLDILDRQVQQEGSVLEILASMSRVAPEDDMNFTRMTYNRNTGVNVWGRAKRIDDIHRFLDRLRALDAERNIALFSQARSLYEQRDVERNEVVFLYQISIPFPGE